MAKWWLNECGICCILMNGLQNLTFLPNINASESDTRVHNLNIGNRIVRTLYKLCTMVLLARTRCLTHIYGVCTKHP